MSIEHTWSIPSFDRERDNGYIFKVNYNVKATDGERSSEKSGSIALEKPSELIPFENLTKDIVIGWIKDRVNVSDLDAKLATSKS